MPGFTCDAVLFDLDGVLLDSNTIYERHWQRWASAHDVSIQAILAVHHGIPAAETIRRVAPHLDAEAEARHYNATVAEQSSAENIRPYDGVSEMLRLLPDGRWAIVTSAARHFALALMTRLGLPIPKVFVSSDDVERGKPAPDPYLTAAAWLGFSPARCVVIEDAPAGVEAGQAAGARVIALLTTNSRQALGRADVVIERFADLAFAASAEGCSVHW